MKQFLWEKTEWIDATLSKMEVQQEILEENKARNEGKILLRGQWKPLKNIGHQEATDVWEFEESDEYVYFKKPKDNRIWPPDDVLVGYYRYLAKLEIPERFYQYSDNLPFKYNKIFIRSQKTKWGTCSNKGNLSFNWRLIKCPYWIWEYLFIHELCHTVHMNHSKTYWKLVESYYPEHKRARKWIKENGMFIFDNP